MTQASDTPAIKKPTPGQLAKEIKAYHAELFAGDGESDGIRAQIADYYDELLTDAEGSPSISTQIKKAKTTALNQAEVIEELHGKLLVDSDDNISLSSQINKYHAELLDEADDANPCIKKQIATAHKTLNQQAKEIDELHDRLLVDDDEEATCLKTEIEKFYSELFDDIEGQKSKKAQFFLCFDAASSQSKAIDKYHNELLVDEKNRLSLKSEFEAFFDQTKKDFTALKSSLTEEIHKLLPSAAAAGLASSYNTARKGYSKAFSQVLYYLLLLIPLVYCAYLYTQPPASLLAMEAAVMEGKADYTTLMIFRGLLAFPLLAISLFGFSSLRLTRRMAEEYNHKQRVMELYVGFKKEIDALAVEMKDKSEGAKLKNELLKIMLRTVEQHPSQAMKEVDRGWLSELVSQWGKKPESANSDATPAL